MIMKNLILIMFLGFLCYTLKAQINTGEIPYSWEKGRSEIMKQSIPIEVLPNLDMKAINQKDLENKDFYNSPVRFGFSHDVNLNLSNSGIWQTTSDGGRLWNMKIYSPDALSLNLLYDKFWLPDGAKLFIYSEDKTQHIGAFTSENNQGDRDNIMGFATGFLFTNSIVLEYYEPKEVKDKGIISITQTISGYRYIYDIIGEENQLKHNNTDFTCHNDINCAVGNNYQNEKNAVAYMVMGGYICTGALINTTANDNRPVFLSANHCFNTSASTTQWIFYWNYEASCNGVANPSSNRSTIGANVLARIAQSDFMLLKLIENPAMNSNISVYYLGWDRRVTSATSGACIHHPKGAQKKISITNNSIPSHSSSINWTDGTTSPANTHWKVVFTNGTTEGGSSGSPLLNQNKRVIGQLHGGSSGCPPNVTKYYGRLDVSWNGGGTSTTRLKDWLDPLNTNVTYLNGTDCHVTLNNKSYNSGTHSIGGCTIEISNTTIEPNTTVKIHGQQSAVFYLGFNAKAGSNVKITSGAGITSKTAENSMDHDNIDSVSMQKSLELAAESTEITNVDFNVYPNPNNGNFIIRITGEIQPYIVEIFNNLGGLLGSINCNDETININRTDLNPGIYYVKITMNEKIVVKKVIVQ